MIRLWLSDIALFFAVGLLAIAGCGAVIVGAFTLARWMVGR